MATLNYSTKIAAARTAGECQDILARAGADEVSVRYRDGRPCGLGFTLNTPHGRRLFTLPVDADSMRRVLAREDAEGKLKAGTRPAGGWSSPEHAERVAWRVVKDWLEAQLALINAQMASLTQVMLPYLLVDPEQTLYAAYTAREQAALEAGS